MTVDEVFPYTSPTAFDAALKDRLQTASVDSPYSLVELRRQFAYDRFLVRVFSVESDRWILKVDLVISSNMTQEPDAVSGLSPVVITGLRMVDYVVYPVVDHVADKHAAMIDTYGSGDRPSSRYRDLFDLVLMATTQRLDAGELRAAMLSECEHRGLGIPSTVEAPDESWEAGYAREAGKVPHLGQQTLASALVGSGPAGLGHRGLKSRCRSVPPDVGSLLVAVT